MANLEEIQSNYSAPRTDLAAAELNLQNATAALQNLDAQEALELRTLSGQELESRKVFFKQKRAELSGNVAQYTAGKKALKKQLADLSLTYLQDLDPVEKITELSDAFPILMFPLRLETRFKSTGAEKQLWLRVYPDDCNINRKEELLSESELANVRAFWVSTWKANKDETQKRGAWKSLVSSHGSGRAAYITGKYKPANEMPVTDDSKKILVVISSLSLTDAEHAAATAYWASVWIAQGNKLLYDEAFAVLGSAVGDARAVEITEKYIPENISDEAAAGLQEEQIVLLKMDLPAEETEITSQTSWTKSPKAMALPDRFAAVAYTGTSKRTLLFDHAVKENLAVGPDPGLNADEQLRKDENGDLIVNDELLWMVDFDNAVEAGMAIKIKLEGTEIINGFDKLFVVGLGLTSDETKNQLTLEKLLNDHFESSDGFGLLKQGTPTNNTEDEPAGYSWTDDPDESYDAVFKGSENFETSDDLQYKSDGEKLADCLGIDPEKLKNIPNANGRDQLEANAMNTALFPATLGYFMEEMMSGAFADRDIEATKIFFSNFVSGRGPVPAIRIGKQPYGILPVSVYSKMQFPGTQDIISEAGASNLKSPYLPRLHNLLMKMDTSWDSMLANVPYIGKEGDPHQILLDVIGLHPGSVEFHQRYAQSIQQVYNTMVMMHGTEVASDVANWFLRRGKEIMTELNMDTKTQLPVLEKYFLSYPNLLSGSIADDVPASEESVIRNYSADKNYIGWLATASADAIRTENFDGNPAPDALLYLLLKHAVTLAQADTATNLLLKHGKITDKKTYYDPDFINVQQEGGGKSKYENLYKKDKDVTGSDTRNLADYIYDRNVFDNSAEAKRLRETINALKILENTPTARLERLLAEHLDCCNYRLDAWKTGLVNYKLTEQRQINQQTSQPSKGLHLGAYGWLLDVRPENKTMTDVQLTPELTEIFNKGNTAHLQTDDKNLGYIHAPSLNQAATAAILRNAYDSNREAGTGNPFSINLTSDRVRIAENFLEGMRNGQSLSALLGYQFERGLHDKYKPDNIEVDKFIYPLRKAFPLVADNLADTLSEDTDSIETIEANNVIDGLKLINHVSGSSVKTYPFGLSSAYNLPAADADQAEAINAEVNRITEINDAISDLIISEQVYQVVQGNFERASGNAEAFSKGNYPPAIDIINTPRSGVTLTQRMALQFDADASADKSPYYDESSSTEKLAMTPRAKAEPAVNKWLASVFPDPENVLCAIEYSNPAIAKTRITISQKELGLQPIDLLYVLNLDTEQAMTEMDDRIMNYCRYELSAKAGFETFIHPKTELKIKYTEQIDAADRTKVSFFELASLVKSLRRILIGSKFLSPAAVTLSEGKAPVAAQMDDVQFNERITALKESLKPVQLQIETISAGIKSVAGLSDSLKTTLSAYISDAAKQEELISKFKLDLEEFLTDAGSESALLTAFESSIAESGAAAIAALKTEYQTLLNAYATDFTVFDNLTKTTTAAFLELARFDNNQTGTGFIQQGISGMYTTVFEKLDVVIKRWNKKSTDYAALIAGYDAAGIEAEQIALLQKAERLISSGSTFPVPALADYKAQLDAGSAAFTALLAELKSLATNSGTEVITFISNAETAVKKIGDHDVITFDTENNRNDLKAEKLQLALLKEGIVTALANALAAISTKIAAGEELISSAETLSSSEKITILQNAAKQITGEEALLVPLFKPDEALANEFEKSFAAQESILTFVKEKENRDFPVEDWLAGVSRVRDKVQDWENVSFLSSAFVPGNELPLAPLQFPYMEADRWAAMTFRQDKPATDTEEADEFDITNDKLLYTAHFATAFDKTRLQCGVILDEWTEVIPAKEETTGIAFHYDQPNSEPAQTMLLAVPPYFSGKWKWEHLIESMEETLEMAKKRAIEPAQIENTGYAQFLPATMMAVTTFMITAATNLAVNNNSALKN